MKAIQGLFKGILFTTELEKRTSENFRQTGSRTDFDDIDAGHAWTPASETNESRSIELV